jgi:cytoskeletal protein CcmA (bactofilin family)
MFGRKKQAISGHIDTLLARGASVLGDVEFEGGLHLDGRVQGQVRSVPGAAATLWVSEQGVIEGSVDVPSVVLNGSVVGDVRALERVVIGPKARISGNVHYGTIEMAMGAQVSGKLIPLAAVPQAPAAAPPPAAATGGAGTAASPGAYGGRSAHVPDAEMVVP